ncbi:MAG TPA: lytic murein transglycosylase, partial [Rhizobiales bacterium]|nr:lytic murein transglycosylase [Hyphomicrobiales bacterium]
LRSHKATLRKLERRFGVDRHILVAIWGLESAYGTRMGELNIIRSLATLAYTGSRRKFGFKQLIGALKILERGDVPVSKFQGSWAGAMGQTQFIPTTYNSFAVDIDGDGRRNVWTSAADALGSTANYLRASKWKKGAPTVIEVRLPKKFNFKYAGLRKSRTMAKWIAMGVRDVDGSRLRSSTKRGAVVVPAGANGPAFIVFNNFRSILRYNNAVSYALAVSYLAKRFKGNGEIVRRWPLENLPLNLAQNRELQELLSKRGHKVGKIDGKVGSNTIRAIKAYQQRQGLKADGYPGSALLKRLRKG